MIKISISRDLKGLIKEFVIKGHAGYADSGNDIVCAAVSAVAYTALGALGELAGINNYVEKNGYMKCNIPDNISPEAELKAKIVLDSMAIGLKQIEHSYKNYVVILEEEV